MTKRHIVELLKVARILLAIDFPTQDAYDVYMKEHPDADPKNHRVVKNQDDKKKTEEPPPTHQQQKSEESESHKQNQEPGKSQEGFFDEKEQQLPREASQSVKNEDELYKQAGEAQEQMKAWLNHDSELQKDLNARYMPADKGFSKDGIEREGTVIITAPLKGKERAREKVKSDYGGDWSKLTDAVRATIAVDSYKHIPHVVKTLKKHGLKLARKPKDRFTKPTEDGYRDILMNMTLPNGHIGELQVNTKAMMGAKNQST